MKNYSSIIVRAIMACIIVIMFAGSLYGQPDSLIGLPQYLLPRFDTGIVRLKSGEFSRSLMNYNTLTGRMTFYYKADVSDLVKAENVDTVLLSKRLFVPFREGFYEVVLNARISFFVQHKSEMISEGKPGALGLTSQTNGVNSVSRFVSGSRAYNLKLPENFKVNRYEIYWLRRDWEMHRFINTHQLVNLFPDKQKELKAYIRKENIDIEKQEDLLKLSIFCNRL
jgi:hypothetical protein